MSGIRALKVKHRNYYSFGFNGVHDCFGLIIRGAKEEARNYFDIGFIISTGNKSIN